MKYQLEEFIPFLENHSRIELKSIAMSHILSKFKKQQFSAVLRNDFRSLGLTGSEEGIEILISNLQLLKTLVMTTCDKTYTTAKDACFGISNYSFAPLLDRDISLFLALINISANSEPACEALLKASPTSHEGTGLLQVILKNITDGESQVTDPLLSVLSNLTRLENLVEQVVQNLLEIDENFLDRIVAVFTRIDFNKHKQNLHYLASVFSNLSQTSIFRKLVAKSETRLLPRLLPFISDERSLMRRRGIVGLLKNICFDTNLHEWLFSPDIDVLPFILLPLAGPEEFDDETNEKLPIELQFLDADKKREANVDIRIMLLESLAQLCATRTGRNYLRDKCAYEILRELHKFEDSSEGNERAFRKCEDVVDILIKTEEEIGHNNLKQIEIPDDMMEKIEKLIE